MEVDNTYNVDKKRWKKWTPAQKRLFEELYTYMRDNQALFIHPKTPILSENQWDTTAWNAAYMAAEYSVL